MENTQIFEMADRLKAAKELKKDLDAQVILSSSPWSS